MGCLVKEGGGASEHMHHVWCMWWRMGLADALVRGVDVDVCRALLLPCRQSGVRWRTELRTGRRSESV